MNRFRVTLIFYTMSQTSRAFGALFGLKGLTSFKKKLFKLGFLYAQTDLKQFFNERARSRAVWLLYQLSIGVLLIAIVRRVFDYLGK